MAKSAASLSQGGLGELKRRLLFVLFGLIIFRIGSYIPVPGLDPSRLAHLFNTGPASGLLGMFNLFSGGAFQRLTIFALSVMPYISASIIIQLLASVYQPLEQLKKEGESGRRKMNQYTRLLTLIIATVQALGMAKLLAAQGVAITTGLSFYITAVICLTTGTMFLMWLGEQMTERGVGNGISLIIFAGIVAGLPGAVAKTLVQTKQGEMSILSLFLIVAIILLVTAFVVFMERAQRRIKINYPQRQQGRRLFAAQSTHLPFKINMSGVIPPIFASAIIMLPAALASWFSNAKGFHWLSDVSLALSPGQPIYLLTYAFMIIFFAFFYTALTMNPKETAENLKKAGAFIPGIRPGEQTSRYIDTVMTRLTLVGALYLVLVALLPIFLTMGWNVPFYFGGTSLLIIVVVLMDFMAQVQSHLMSHQYESLMRKSN
ncbi:MAG: preprotein translocase subunit SecY, partial [Gammaproteobacteria bacterium]|nr:preprotein translocase subunit SecY [Gammaproteobacteria bacterium]